MLGGLNAWWSSQNIPLAYLSHNLTFIKETHPYITLAGGKATRIKALSNLNVPINLDPISDPLLWDTIRICLEKRVENRDIDVHSVVMSQL